MALYYDYGEITKTMYIGTELTEYDSLRVSDRKLPRGIPSVDAVRVGGTYKNSERKIVIPPVEG